MDCNLPLTITFLNPVSEILLGWWDPNFPGNFLRAYDVNDQLLEEVELTDLGPPHGLWATWIGFKRPSPDISRIEVDPAIYPPYDNYGIDNIYYNTTVSIKINAINLRSKNISVAILSSEGFNTSQMIDKSTLTFGPTGIEASPLSCTRKPRDVNGDGFKDLVCSFPTKVDGQLIFDCTDTEGILTGLMTAGNSFEGRQAVEITPCK